MLTADEGEVTQPARPRHPAVWALAIVVFAECALMAAAAVFLVVELLIDVPESYPGAIMLAVICAAVAVWLGAAALGVLRGRPWVRGAIVVWQILQLAVVVGAFQGLLPRPDIGWLLLLPVIAALVLLFSKPVVAATTRQS